MISLYRLLDTSIPIGVSGQSVLVGPSLYRMVTDDSNIPASGAISSIGES